MSNGKRMVSCILVFLAAWWVYADEQTTTFTFRQCIAYALKHNTAITRADNTIKSAQSSLKQSKTALLPDLEMTVSPSASYSKSYPDNDGSTIKSSGSDADLNVTLSSGIRLYAGGKLKNTIRQNEYTLSASKATGQTEQEQLGIGVLSAYLNVLLAKEQVKNGIAQLQSTEKQLEYAEVRNAAGIISKADYLNIKSQFASDKVDSVRAENTLHLNLVALMQKMNMPVDAGFDVAEISGESFTDTTEEPDADDIYTRALESRPEIQAALFNLESSKAGVEIAKALGKPSLSLSMGARSTTAYGSGSGDGSSALSPSVGLSLSLPLYQRGTVENQIEQASLAADNSSCSLDEVKSDLRKGIEQTCSDLRCAAAGYRAMEEQYLSALESYRTAEEMFGQGLMNSVDYLMSKNSLAAVVSDLTQAKYAVVLQKKLVDHYLGKSITL